MCAQGRLRSSWASAQSDQSFRCPHEESVGPYLPIERTSKTMIRLGGVTYTYICLIVDKTFMYVSEHLIQSVVTSVQRRLRTD